MSCAPAGPTVEATEVSAINATVDSGATEKVDSNPSTDSPVPAPIVKEVPIVSATEAGEDAFAVEDHSTAAHSAAATPINIEIGMPYTEARSRIIQQGWVPDPQPLPGPYGVENAFHEIGFTEVESCAGTGLGPCLFYFTHPDRTGLDEENVLRVGTNGGASHPNISGWETYHFSETAAAAPPSNATTTEIPAQFRGEWNPDLDDCYASHIDGRLILESNYVRFDDSFGPVTKAVMLGDDQVVVSTELSSEGSTYGQDHTFNLSDDGSSLNTSTGIVRYRCP
ncbi:MAG: hypothetical protein WBD47_18830 [Phormidesmis sp.]